MLLLPKFSKLLLLPKKLLLLTLIVAVLEVNWHETANHTVGLFVVICKHLIDRLPTRQDALRVESSKIFSLFVSDDLSL